MNLHLYTIPLLLFFLLPALPPTLQAQSSCPPNVLLSSQAEVDAFSLAGSGAIGALQIAPASGQSTTDITNLDALAGLTALHGSLIIEKNPQLSDISGLTNLQTIGANDVCVFEQIIIRENPLIPDLSALSNLSTDLGDGSVGVTSITGNLFLQDMPLVTDLSPLSGITGTDFLWVGNMPNITTIDGLSGLMRLEDIYLTSNTNLLNIDGLANVSGPFREGQQSLISGNVALQNLNGLAGVTRANILTIRFCHSLTDLSGLGGITLIQEDLSINNNNGITSMSGLHPDLVIEDKLTIVNNPQLSTCAVAAVCVHLQGNGLNFISSNPAGCANPTDVLDNCSTECGENDNLVFSTQAEVDAFTLSYPNCSIFLGNLTIDESAGTATGATAVAPITNLNAFAGLKEINDLLILNAPQLTSLSPLADLDSVNGNLSIQFTGIVDLNELSSLQKVGLRLTIANNFSLQSVTDFSNITTLGRDLTIFNNPLLSDISGFSNITTLGDFLTVGLNPSLTSLSALSNLQLASDGVNIESNANLSSLQGLESLQNIGGFLKIANNNLLTDISALTNLDQAALTATGMIQGQLVIDNNPMLSNCAINSVCNLLAGPGVSINIQGNASTCADQPSLQTACAALLPVDFLHFTATALGRNVQLSWATSSETNNSGFHVERSADGRTWASIGFVPGQGTSLQTNTYRFVDETPKTQHLFYRLKQIDYDGSFIYSGLRHIVFDHAPEVTIYPNPAQKTIYLSGLSALSTIYITNQYGQLVQQQFTDGEVDISSLAAGLYYLHCQREGEAKITLRFLKNNSDR